MSNLFSTFFPFLPKITFCPIFSRAKMEVFQAGFLGVLQGGAEFLPISSSGHLFLAETFLGLNPSLGFQIALHGFSILAVLVFFWREIWELISEIFQPKKWKTSLALKLLFATFLTAPVALLCQKFLFAPEILTPKWVGFALILTGFLVLGSDFLRGRKKAEKNFSWTHAAVLGLVQGLAVVPGISRAGLTISVLLALGIDGKKAAKISFLLAVPTIFAAIIFAAAPASGASFELSTSVLVGGFLSFFAAILAIKFMIFATQKYWIWWAPYCFLAGGVVIFLAGK